MDIHKVNWFI